VVPFGQTEKGETDRYDEAFRNCVLTLKNKKGNLTWKILKNNLHACELAIVEVFTYMLMKAVRVILLNISSSEGLLIYIHIIR
jgi:hypothetical protein